MKRTYLSITSQDRPKWTAHGWYIAVFASAAAWHYD